MRLIYVSILSVCYSGEVSRDVVITNATTMIVRYSEYQNGRELISSKYLYPAESYARGRIDADCTRELDFDYGFPEIFLNRSVDDSVVFADTAERIRIVYINPKVDGGTNLSARPVGNPFPC